MLTNFETSKIECHTLYMTYYCTICDTEFSHVMAALKQTKHTPSIMNQTGSHMKQHAARCGHTRLEGLGPRLGLPYCSPTWESWD